MPRCRSVVSRTAVAAAALAGLGLAVPSAGAAPHGDAAAPVSVPTPARAVPQEKAAPVTATANSATRAIAASRPSAVKAAALICGSGWTLDYAETLPPHLNRLGTLFIYTKAAPTNDPNDVPVCSIFDNNTASRKWMKLKVCSNYIDDGCAEDVGNYTQYAGPVYRTRGGCGKVTAIMKNSASSSAALIDAVRSATTCD